MPALRMTMTPCRVVLVLCLAVAVAAQTVICADDFRVISSIPRFQLFTSSHSTAAAEVLAYHGVKKELPRVVLIGGLEARIYRCECGKSIDLWDIAAGTKVWAGAEGLKVKTEAKVLRGPWNQTTRSEPPINANGRREALGMTASAGSPDPAQVAAEKDRLDFAQYRHAIDSGHPVVLTYSLDAASAQGMDASFRSQERVSVVGMGYQDDDTARNAPEGGQPLRLRSELALSEAKGQAPAPTISNPSRYLVALLPEGPEREKRFERLLALPGVKPGSKEGLVLIPWDIQTGNLIATFIEVLD